MAKEHEAFLVRFLQWNKNKSYIGSDLIKILFSEYKDMTEVNARKIISNCSKAGRIDSSSPVTFANNQFVYYSKEANINYYLYKNNIIKYKPKLFRVIFALSRKSGIISINELCNISGVNIECDSHDIKLEKLLLDLDNLNIAELFDIEGLQYLKFKSSDIIPERIASVVDDGKDKNLLLSTCCTWLTRSNIVDFKQLCYLGAKNDFKGILRNDMYWDAFGFTNTIGIGSLQKDYQTIVVVDFLYDARYEEYDFLGFKERVDSLVFSVKQEKRKVLPIIIATDFSPVAKTLIKKRNYMCFSLSSILGRNAVLIAKEYRKSIATIEETISKKEISFLPQHISEMCETIRNNGNEINYGNLKGTLFEYLMYPVFCKIFNKNGTRITHSFSKSVDNDYFECDYRIETEDENIFIELKAYDKEYVIPLGKFDLETKEIDKQSIKWFLNHTYELAKKCVGEERKNKFCYITTSKIEELAKIKMESRIKDKSEILGFYYEYEDLINLLEKYELKNEIKIIEQFYS